MQVSLNEFTLFFYPEDGIRNLYIADLRISNKIIIDIFESNFIASFEYNH